MKIRLLAHAFMLWMSMVVVLMAAASFLAGDTACGWLTMFCSLAILYFREESKSLTK